MRTGLALAFTSALAASTGCGGTTPSPGLPLWERPGLYGAIRPEMGPPQPGDRAPDFELPAPGGTFRLASLRGTWVVLHFTASWCPYCDAEVDHLGELAGAYAPRGAKVVLIGVKEEPAHWSEYARGHVASSVLTLSDGDGAVARAYAPPRAQPSFEDRSQVMLDSTVIVDPAGTIRLVLFPDSKHFDPTFQGVRGELDRLLGVRSDRGAEPLLAPEKVVTVAVTAPPPVAPGGRGDLTIELAIAPGYHVMSDSPSEPNYIATRVRFEEANDLAWGQTRYPQPVAFQLSNKAISTFQGKAVVSAPFDVAAGAGPGERTLPGTVRYQACTLTSCLFPVTRRISATVVIAAR